MRYLRSNEAELLLLKEVVQLKTHRIEYATRRGHDPVLWANYLGPKTKAMRSARGLMEDLKDHGVKGPRVWVDGKRVHAKRNGEEGQ